MVEENIMHRRHLCKLLIAGAILDLIRASELEWAGVQCALQAKLHLLSKPNRTHLDGLRILSQNCAMSHFSPLF